jgi:hypothetical protein
LDDPVNGSDALGLMGIFEGLMSLFSPDVADAAFLTTNMKDGTTTFDPRPEVPDGKATTIKTRNKVTRNSKPGANDPYKTGDVRVLKKMPRLQKLYGPDGAYIDTGDPRGRDIHGGEARRQKMRSNRSRDGFQPRDILVSKMKM